MVETTMEEMAPKGSFNYEKYKISEKYTVVFYTTERCAVFQYFWDGYRTEAYKTSRNCVLFWISPEEKEKLFAFERKKKEKYIGYEVHGAPEKDEEKSHKKKQKIKIK